MGTWSGWQADLLKAGGFLNTPENRKFLSDWHAHAASNCGNNPIDLSHKETGSTNCHKLTSTRNAQKYTNHATAESAFKQQIHSGNFPHLLGAFQAGAPEGVSNFLPVAEDIQKWGSIGFGIWYANLMQGGGQGSGSGSGGPNTGHVHKAYSDLAHTLNTKWHPTLNRRHSIQNATLRKLNQASKVRL